MENSTQHRQTRQTERRPGTYVVTFEKPEITGSVETEVDAFRGMYSDPAKSQWDYYHRKGENSLQPFELK